MVVLLVLFLFTGMVLAEVLLQGKEARKLAAVSSPAPAGAVPSSWRLAPPGACFLDRGHTWAAIDPSGALRIGWNALVAGAVGRIDALELPEPGAEVRRGDRLFAVRQGDRRAEFASPVDGVVAEPNLALAAASQDASRDPYGRGWVCLLRPAHLASAVRDLLVGEEASAWLAEEVERLRSTFVSRAAPAFALGEVRADGGELVPGFLEGMTDADWDLFAREFCLRPAAC